MLSRLVYTALHLSERPVYHSILMKRFSFWLSVYSKVFNSEFGGNTCNFKNSLCDAFLGLTVAFEFMINYSSHGKRPSISAEESDPAAIQIPKCPLYVIQGSEQVGLVTCDPVQLQVQQGYAWKKPPPQRKAIITFRTWFYGYVKNLYKTYISGGQHQRNYTIHFLKIKKQKKENSG